jgi:hypothetical protein
MAKQCPLAAASSQHNGSGPTDEFDLAGWVRRSTEAQGVSEKVADEHIILTAARLLRPALRPRPTHLLRRRSIRAVARPHSEAVGRER